MHSFLQTRNTKNFVLDFCVGATLYFATDLGIRPGIGRPALHSFKKYFCTLLETCFAVLFPNAAAIFLNLLTSIGSGGYINSNSSNRFCSSVDHG